MRIQGSEGEYLESRLRTCIVFIHKCPYRKDTGLKMTAIQDETSNTSSC